MAFCPICRSEFRKGFTRCEACDVELVYSLEEAPPKMDEASMAEYLADRELLVVARAPLDRLKPLKSLLCERSIANIIMRTEDGCAGGGCSPNLELAVDTRDAEKVGEIIKGDFASLVATVTEDEGTIEAIVDYNAEDICCPACNEPIAKGLQECPSCGLFVGVPEELVAEGE